MKYNAFFKSLALVFSLLTMVGLVWSTYESSLVGASVFSVFTLIILGSVVLRTLQKGQKELALKHQELVETNRRLDENVVARTQELRDREANLKKSIGQLEQEIELRRNTEKSLRRLVTAVEHCDQTIVITDATGTIEYANPAFERITGYTREEAVGANPNLLSSGKQDGAFYETMWKTLRAGETWRGCFVNKRKDGTLFEEEATISPVQDSHGEIKNFVAVKRDVTERNELECQLRSAQKLESIGQLAAGIAHEINTPTQFIGDNTRFLQESFLDLMPVLQKAGELSKTICDGKDSSGLAQELKLALVEADVEYLIEEVPKALEQSLGGIDRVRNIVRSMKEFSHPGAEEMVNVDLNRAIQSTIIVATNEWKYVAKLETDYDADLPPVPCLPGEFNQVILNMIVNAAHAIKDTLAEGELGTITVRTSLEEKFAVIRISDTGTGIPEEVQGKIFDPFFTTKEVGKGTGQGLSIAHGVVVKKHGGTIDFETQAGKGTTFIVHLPLSQSKSASEPVHA